MLQFFVLLPIVKEQKKCPRFKDQPGISTVTNAIRLNLASNESKITWLKLHAHKKNYID